MNTERKKKSNLNVVSKQKISLVLKNEQVITVIVLLAVSIVSFGLFRSTIISSDDWSYFVWKYAFGELRPILWNDRRPFVLVFYYVMASIFGLHFEYYYFANFLILFSSAFLVFAIVKQVFPEYGWLASLTALVYLIYPVDYSRTWFIMIYIRLMWLFSLIAIWLLLKFVVSGNWWTFAAAMLAIAFPLGAYEGQFGVILLTGVLIAIAMPKMPIKRRFMPLGGVFLVGILFLVWRFFVQETYLEIKDVYVETIQFTPVLLLQRYIHGLDIFAKGWLAPIATQLGRTEFELLVSWLLWILISYLIIWRICSNRPMNKESGNQQTVLQISPYLKFIALGGAFWMAGYVPIIALYTPSLSGHASRVNLFAIPGAALMLVSMIAIFSTLATNSTFAMRSLTTLSLLPFIVASIFVQLQVNQENQVAWETQKEIWNGVFEAIPNIADEKQIVIIVPGYNQLRPFESLPFLSGWEVESSAQILYNNPSIQGSYYYKDIQPTELLFTQNGFKPIPTDKIISYKKLIFVYYDPQNRTVKLVEDLVETLALPYETKNYSPHENVVPAIPSTSEYRWLVQ